MSVCWCYYVIFRGLVGYGGVGWLVGQKKQVCMEGNKIPSAIHSYAFLIAQISPNISGT